MQIGVGTDPGTAILETAPVILVIKATEETDSLIMIVTGNIPGLQMTLMNLMLVIMHKAAMHQLIHMMIEDVIDQVQIFPILLSGIAEQIQDILTLLSGMIDRIQDILTLLMLMILKDMTDLGPGVQTTMMISIIRGLVDQTQGFQMLRIERDMTDPVPMADQILG